MVRVHEKLPIYLELDTKITSQKIQENLSALFCETLPRLSLNIFQGNSFGKSNETLSLEKVAIELKVSDVSLITPSVALQDYSLQPC